MGEREAGTLHNTVQHFMSTSQRDFFISFSVSVSLLFTTLSGREKLLTSISPGVCSHKTQPILPRGRFNLHLLVDISTILMNPCKMDVEFFRSTAIPSPARHFPPRFHTKELAPTYVRERVISPVPDRPNRSSREYVVLSAAALDGYLFRTTSQAGSDGGVVARLRRGTLRVVQVQCFEIKNTTPFIDDHTKRD